MEYTSKELFWKKLYEAYDYGYKIDNEETEKGFKENLQKKIINRIDFLYDIANYFVIEDNYIEPEWKAMIAKHYINSAYSTTLKQSVIRIHFLSENNFTKNSYLGFITLRPLEEMEISLSFVYLNWEHSFFNGQKTYVMTYPKEIHYMGKSITIHTYPFFAQDTIVTCCADANVIMLTKYFSNKYKLAINRQNNVKVVKKHNLPKKVDVTRFPDMLSESEIPYRSKLCEDITSTGIENKKIEKEIFSYIESGLPVVLIGDGHVIQLIGYTVSEEIDVPKFIVYDDSGYLEKIVCGDNSKKHITYLMSIGEIMNYFSKRPYKKNRKMRLFFLEHERVYIDYRTYNSTMYEYLVQLYKLDENKSSAISKVFLDNGIDKVFFRKEIKIRTMLADNSKVKEFFLKNYNINQKEIIGEFVKKALPHYLWYTEITTEENRTFCLCADPTMYHQTRDYMKLFLDTGKRMIIGLKQGEHLSLLTEGQ